MTSTLASPPERVTTWRLGGRSRKTVLLLHILAAGTWFGLMSRWRYSSSPRSSPNRPRCALTLCSHCASSRVADVQCGDGQPDHGGNPGPEQQVRLAAVLVGGDQACAQHPPQHTDRHRFTRRGRKAADLGSRLAAGADLDWNFSSILYPPIVSPTALTVAFVLAVFKPWGHIRRRRARQGGKS
jgi:hypothetical protein